MVSMSLIFRFRYLSCNFPKFRHKSVKFKLRQNKWKMIFKIKKIWQFKCSSILIEQSKSRNLHNSTIKNKISREIWGTPWFCYESLHCVTSLLWVTPLCQWVSRAPPHLFLLFLILTVENFVFILKFLIYESEISIYVIIYSICMSRKISGHGSKVSARNRNSKNRLRISRMSLNVLID